MTKIHDQLMLSTKGYQKKVEETEIIIRRRVHKKTSFLE
jgi:hypothetical protein